jgi:CPA2 family monovalent cation:H+ antiporter-2
MTNGLLDGILVLLIASVVLVWLFQHLRLSPVLGYLLAGILVGPHGLGLIAQSEDIRVLADLGLVFLMFTVGLEFSLPQLLAAKATVLGLGAGQVAITALLFGGLAWLLGMSLGAAIMVGGAAAMSSTALVVKQLGEQRELDTQHGYAAVGVLLFQDLAVIPFLIIIPILAGQGDMHPAWALLIALAQGTGVLLVLYLSGRWSLRPLFARIAAIRSPELFMLTVLLVSLGAAWLSQVAGLSQAMGAFLAGIIIGETEFKRQVEADIRPFQDALVGLFFISMGMLLDLSVLPEMWLHVLVTAALLIGLKAIVVTGLAARLHMPFASALRAGIVLGQGGEFGLVLVFIALGFALVPAAGGQIVLTGIILSMALAPLLIRFNETIAHSLYRPPEVQGNTEPPAEETREVQQEHVIICGYGRVGQAIARILDMAGYRYHALDTDARRVRIAQDAGEHVTYGDATRQRLLESVGLASARALVITFRDMEAALKILDHVRVVQPGMPTLLRAADDADLDRLLQAGAAEVIPETLESSLTLAAHLLLLLGAPANTVLNTVWEVREARYRPLRGFIPDQVLHGREGSARYHQYLHAVPLSKSARVVGHTLAQINPARWGVSVIALRRRDIRVAEPTPETVLQEGDILILSGTKQALRRVESYLQKSRRRLGRPSAA